MTRNQNQQWHPGRRTRGVATSADTGGWPQASLDKAQPQIRSARKCQRSGTHPEGQKDQQIRQEVEHSSTTNWRVKTQHFVVVAECTSQPKKNKIQNLQKARKEPKRPSWKHLTENEIEDTSANSGTESDDKQKPSKTREPEEMERHTKGQTDKKARKPEKGRKRARGKTSPTGGGNQVTRQTRRTVDRTRRTSQDCTRVFPVKGAADALCNPETDVHGGAGGQAAGHAGLRGNPSHDAPEGLGPSSSPIPPPPPPASLQDKRAKGGLPLGNQGSRVLKSALPGFHLVEDIGNRWESRREVRGAKQRRDEEVPGLSEARDAFRNPNIGRAATSGREWGRNRGGVDIGVVTPRIGRPRGEEKARLLKLRRDRRELSDRGADHIADRVVAQDPISPTATSKGRDLPSGRELLRTCRKPCRDPTTVCEDDAGEPRGKVEKKYGNRCTTGWQ